MAVALARVGCPYVWWSKGMERGTMYKVPTPTGPREFFKVIDNEFLAFDCSGFVTDTLLAAGLDHLLDMRFTHNTDMMFKDEIFEKVEFRELKLGDLVFYGTENQPQTDADDDPMHVMVWCGSGRVVGATGGGRATLEPTAGKKVLVKPWDYRKDNIGFRSIRRLVSNP